MVVRRTRNEGRPRADLDLCFRQPIKDGFRKVLFDLDGISQSGLLYESWEDHTAWQSGVSSLGRCRSVLPVRLNRREMAFSLVEGAFNDGKGEQGAHE